MTRDDRAHWDAKHAAALDAPPGEPDAWVVAALDGMGDLRGRRALDLACGRGRHAAEFARRGAAVEAWDVSPVALEVVAARVPGATTRVVDLARGPVPEATFDLVVCVDFLLRDLALDPRALVAAGGVFVWRTFATDWPGEHPSPRWRAAPGEPARVLAGLEVVAADHSGGRTGIVARR